MLRDNIDAGRLRFTTDYEEAAEFADVHFLGVGTPQKKGEYGADLRHVYAVIDTLVPRLRRSAVIVGKSTVPVGTAAELAERARSSRPRASTSRSRGIRSSSAEGFAVHDTLHPDRIVLGVQRDSVRAEAAVRELYAPLLGEEVPFLVTDLQTAELVKVSANAFLATKISFINAISEVCEAADADVTHARRRAGLRPPYRPAIPQRRPGIRRRLPAQGHPRVHGAGRRTRRQPRADVPARGGQHQHAPPHPDGRAGHEGVRRFAARGQRRRARRGVQARIRRRPRLARAQRGRSAPTQRRHGQRLRPQGDGELATRLPDAELLDVGHRGLRARRRGAGAHRVAGVRRPRSRRAGRTVRAKVIVDGRNCLDVASVAARRMAGLRAGPSDPGRSSRRSVVR